jgi:hypothetical protein
LKRCFQYRIAALYDFGAKETGVPFESIVVFYLASFLQSLHCEYFVHFIIFLQVLDIVFTDLDDLTIRKDRTGLDIEYFGIAGYR